MDLARELIKRGKYRVKRICRSLQVSRSNQYAHPDGRPRRYRKPDDPEVLQSVLAVTKERATYGYQRVTALINRERKKNLKKT